MLVIYYYREKKGLKHKILLFMSDCFKHAVPLQVLQSSLKKDIEKHGFNKIIIYFAVGARQHFKNLFQISNLNNHDEDLGVSADYQVHVTVLGKNKYAGL